MSSTPIKREVVIRNEQGFHMRPAEMFVRCAYQFKSKIEVVREAHRVDARSMIDLITLGAAKGTHLTIEAEGEDAQAAIDALADLVENTFPQEDNETQH